MFLSTLFWLLLLVRVVTFFIPLSPPASRICAFIPVALIAILGWKVFGNPLH